MNSYVRVVVLAIFLLELVLFTTSYVFPRNEWSLSSVQQERSSRLLAVFKSSKKQKQEKNADLIATLDPPNDANAASAEVERMKKALSRLLGKSFDLALAADDDDQSLLEDDDDYDGEEDEVDDKVLSDEEVLNGVIRVYCTHNLPNHQLPWQRLKQDFSTSSGFVISNRRILTNAHAVEYGSLIQVKKRSSERKYLARVTAIGHECDLAILEVQDEDFWTSSTCTSLQLGAIPALQSEVSVVGYPIGGDSISITQGVVSRIEMQEYVQASADLLAIQIDAAINPGNSGGPVVNGRNEVIGVAFQSLSSEEAENIGYVIPSLVIDHFLATIDRNQRKYGLGFYEVCALGVHFQKLQSTTMRRYYGLDTAATQLATQRQAKGDKAKEGAAAMEEEEEELGICIIEIAALSPVRPLLCRDDILLAIDDISIASDGTIPFHPSSSSSSIEDTAAGTRRRRDERVHMSYYYTQLFAGDTVRFTVWRRDNMTATTNCSNSSHSRGQLLEVEVPLYIPQPLIPQLLLAKPIDAYNGESLVAVAKQPPQLAEKKQLRGSSKKNKKDEEQLPLSVQYNPALGRLPSYLVVGGLVFVKLTREYLRSELDLEAMKTPEYWTEEFKLLARVSELQSKPREEIVVLSQILSHPCNLGYSANDHPRLAACNGQEVLNLQHLKSLLDEALQQQQQQQQQQAQEGRLIFELADKYQIVLDVDDVRAAQQQICEEHLIPSPYSADLR